MKSVHTNNGILASKRMCTLFEKKRAHLGNSINRGQSGQTGDRAHFCFPMGLQLQSFTSGVFTNLKVSNFEGLLRIKGKI
jgi:hypothetical protein